MGKILNALLAINFLYPAKNVAELSDNKIDVIKNPLRTKNKFTPYMPLLVPPRKYKKWPISTIRIAIHRSPSSLGL